MSKYVIILLTCIISTYFAHSQIVKDPESKVVMVYMSENMYLLPVISNSLTALKSRNSKESYFDKVIVLNRLIDNIQTTSIRRELLLDYNIGSDYVISSEAVQAYLKYSESIGKFNYLIDIKSYVINDLMEIQFLLYKTDSISSSTTNILQVPVNITESKSISVILDLKDKKFRDKINDAILNLFSFLSCPPEIKINVNDKFISSGDTCFIGLGDTVFLSSSSTYDKDTPFDKLTFNWQQIGSNKYNPYIWERIELKNETPDQKIYLPRLGTYKIVVSATDNVNTTYDTLIIKVIEKPRTFTCCKIYKTWEINTLLQKQNQVYYSNWTTRNKFKNNEYLDDTIMFNYFYVGSNYSDIEGLVLHEYNSYYNKWKTQKLENLLLSERYLTRSISHRIQHPRCLNNYDTVAFTLRFSKNGVYGEPVTIYNVYKVFSPIEVKSGLKYQRLFCSEDFYSASKTNQISIELGLKTTLLDWLITDIKLSYPIYPSNGILENTTTKSYRDTEYTETTVIEDYYFRVYEFAKFQIIYQPRIFVVNRLKFGGVIGFSAYYYESEYYFHEYDTYLPSGEVWYSRVNEGGDEGGPHLSFHIGYTLSYILYKNWSLYFSLDLYHKEFGPRYSSGSAAIGISFSTPKKKKNSKPENDWTMQDY